MSERTICLHCRIAESMAQRLIPRFVLIGDYLEPNHVHILDTNLAKLEIFVEIRRTSGLALPFEHLRDLANNVHKLILDPFTSRHEEVIDCLMLGADQVCISADSPKRELELAYAASKHVFSRWWIEDWPPHDDVGIAQHHSHILEVAKTCGRQAIVTCARKGVLKSWWQELPPKCKQAFDWHFAPAEGRVINLDVPPAAWLLPSGN